MSLYNTFVNYTGDGSTTDFAIPFSYADQSDVTVHVNGVNVTAFTFVNPSLLRCSVAPANGTVVRVARFTDITSPKVVFANGTSYTAQQLNDANTQLRNGMQEAIDTYADATSGAAADYAAEAAISATAAATSATAAAASAVAAATFNPSTYPTKANNLNDLANVATARTNLGLGSAATLTAGTGANNAVQLDGSAKLPAVDGSALTGVKGVVLGSISGLTSVSNATTSWVDTTAGAAADATGTVNMVLASAMTKKLNVTWAAGTNAGGFATGESLPTSGTFHLWLIAKADGTTDIMANNHATTGLSPTLPAGYIYKRRIVSGRTNGSAAVIAFVQFGNDVFIASQSNGFPSSSLALFSLTVPNGILVRARLALTMNQNAGGDSLLYFSSGFAAPSTALELAEVTNLASDQNVTIYTTPPTNTSGQVYAQYTDGGGGLVAGGVSTTGWTDLRG
jgi:Phage T7 tail fibre protein